MWKSLWWRLVRLGFHLLYNEMAWTYDAVSWLASLGEWRRWQRAALPYVTGSEILEIAHGPGHMLQALAEAGHMVTGLDLSPTMGRLAARRLQRAGLDAALVRGQGQALPFSAQSFDSVLSTFPTTFIAEYATMTEIYRVLRPGGRFIIVPEGHLEGRGLITRFINWLYFVTGQRQENFSVDKNQYWPAESPLWDAFREAMEGVGFQLKIEHLTLERSGVTVVIATRT